MNLCPICSNQRNHLLHRCRLLYLLDRKKKNQKSSLVIKHRREKGPSQQGSDDALLAAAPNIADAAHESRTAEVF
ncbi:unnamed protein product [Caenorhabditis auriculariae]|uniref:Uncharacterized protein n=1 Tax=Caenorhabditis auriculariae TaxID=2777116 RepID=A0A8S1HLA2_9PELO|nr:unnamed protein product [Caenorhabditis auriculariae]